MGTSILARSSEPSREAADGRESAVEDFISEFVKEPRTALWKDGLVTRIDMLGVFGVDAFYPNSLAWVDVAEIADVSVNGEQMTLTLRAKATGLTLSLTLGPSLELESASREGRRVYALGGRGPWGSPANGTLASAQGGVPVLGLCREYTSTDLAGEVRLVGIGRALLVTETGGLWIGPSDCAMGVIGERILGMKLDESGRDLLVFAGPRTMIPLSSKSQEFAEVVIGPDLNVVSTRILSAQDLYDESNPEGTIPSDPLVPHFIRPNK